MLARPAPGAHEQGLGVARDRLISQPMLLVVGPGSAGIDELLARDAVGLQGKHSKKEIPVGGHGDTPDRGREIASWDSELSRAGAAAAMKMQRTPSGRP